MEKLLVRSRNKLRGLEFISSIMLVHRDIEEDWIILAVNLTV